MCVFDCVCVFVCMCVSPYIYLCDHVCRLLVYGEDLHPPNVGNHFWSEDYGRWSYLVRIISKQQWYTRGEEMLKHVNIDHSKKAELNILICRLNKFSSCWSWLFNGIAEEQTVLEVWVMKAWNTNILIYVCCLIWNVFNPLVLYVISCTLNVLIQLSKMHTRVWEEDLQLLILS